MNRFQRGLQAAVAVASIGLTALACSDDGAPIQEPETEVPILEGSAFDLGFGACGGVSDIGYMAYSYAEESRLGLQVLFGPDNLVPGWQLVPLGEGASVELYRFQDPSPTFFCDDVAGEVVTERWVSSQGTVQVWLGPVGEFNLREVEVRLDRVLFEEEEGERQQLLDHLTIGRSQAGWLPG